MTVPATTVLPLVGPGLVGPGTRVQCDLGALPRNERGSGVVVSLGRTTSRVQLHDGRIRRIPNTVLRLDDHHVIPQQWATTLPQPIRAAELPFYPRASNPRTYGWLPAYAWIGWSLAEHLAYARGERAPAPR
jgi:hypothetical protein